MLTSTLALIGLTLAPASPPPPCSVGELRATPGYAWRAHRIAQMVDSAAEIVRVQAVGVDSMAGKVTFEPLEWIRRASDDTANFELDGTVVERDDFNSRSVPYGLVRSAGQRGDCFASEYRLGAQYLLLFTDRPRPRTIRWWPLAPVNEQLRGEGDPWLAWVRRQASARRER